MQTNDELASEYFSRGYGGPSSERIVREYRVIVGYGCSITEHFERTGKLGDVTRSLSTSGARLLEAILANAGPRISKRPEPTTAELSEQDDRWIKENESDDALRALEESSHD